MTVAALIVAAGRGARMGAPVPKALHDLCGESILARAVAAFSSHPRIDRLVAAVTDPGESRKALRAVDRDRVVLVPGGPDRGASVRSALDAVGDADIVLVHDAARPLVPAPIIDAVIEATIRHGAAVPAIPVPDTVKRLAPDGMIAETVTREGLVLAQTPQGFRLDLLLDAYARARSDRFQGTDDAGLVERAGGRVAIVEGSSRNLKITTRADLALAAALLRSGPEGGH